MKRAFAALAAAQVVYGLGSRPPAATRALVGAMLGVSALEARRAGDGRALTAAGAVGFAAEIVGVATGRPFGHYRYSSKLGPRVRGVPVLAAAAWAMMARPAWVVAGRLTAGRARRVVFAAGALTAWDVFLDPRMAHEGYWEWPGGGRYEGVPASNFAGWFLTGLLVFSAYAVLADDDDLHGRRRRHSAGAATAPMAVAPAAATRGRRHSAALANVSPPHVHPYSARAPSSSGPGASGSSAAQTAKTPSAVTNQPAKFDAGTSS